MAASRRQSPTPRRVIPIKRADGEPLTRADIQYDLLQAIFDDPQEVFTNPYFPHGTEAGGKFCFRNLYINSILHSPKATKALKDKMNESSEFALDFAMLSLLVNVGRVNTTMSCECVRVPISIVAETCQPVFPEMKTAIRTYHPIPSLQRTNGNMQDAPRIKHILKTSLLQEEAKNPPATPAEILSRCVS
jgi:Ino eighty subunit 1